MWLKCILDISSLESVVLPNTLKVLGERVLAGRENLKHISFGEGSALEEIEPLAFYECALESFTAPPKLKKIGDLAFGHCRALKDFRLNEGIQELGFLCFWATAIEDLKIPKRLRRTSEQLGLDQKSPRVLCLPDGLKAIGDGWFERSEVRKVVVSSSVRTFGKGAFRSCSNLSEVVFAPRSHLESIGEKCFEWSGLERICIPRSVRRIEERAFGNCGDLAQLSFQSLSKLEHIGDKAFGGTKLNPETIRYPPRLRKAEHKNEW